MNVRLAGGYPLRQLDRLLRDLGPLLRLRNPPALVRIDLSGLVFVSPTGLAVLTAALAKLVDGRLWAPGTTLYLPKSRPVRQYLQRMDAFRHFNANIEETFERRTPLGFRSCQRFTGDDCHVVSRELRDAISERVPTDALGRGSLHIALDEVAENVIFHAQSRFGGFAAAQGWPKRQQMEAAIVDLGRGIRASLMSHPAYADIKDDVTAIQTALKPKVTATPERNTGLGLAVTQLLLADNGGELMVRSGNGAVYTGSVERVATFPLRFPGTIVSLTARTDRALDVNAVYRQLGLVDVD